MRVRHPCQKHCLLCLGPFGQCVDFLGGVPVDGCFDILLSTCSVFSLSHDDAHICITCVLVSCRLSNMCRVLVCSYPSIGCTDDWKYSNKGFNGDRCRLGSPPDVPCLTLGSNATWSASFHLDTLQQYFSVFINLTRDSSMNLEAINIPVHTKVRIHETVL
jgi:hypothetical protein